MELKNTRRTIEYVTVNGDIIRAERSGFVLGSRTRILSITRIGHISEKVDIVQMRSDAL